jgi:Na+/melibiose symporter-like transporter
MIADVADEDELATGQRREGTLFGISSLGEQLASGLAVLGTGVAIDRFAGLVPGQTVQSGLTVERIGLLYGLVPAAVLLLAAFAILRYPLDGRRVRAIQAQLSAADTRRLRPAGAVDPAPSGELADSRRERNPAR